MSCGSCICTATRPSRWTVIVRKCCPGECLHLALVMSASAMDHTIYELCLPSEFDLGMRINMADLVSSGGRTVGRVCPCHQYGVDFGLSWRDFVKEWVTRHSACLGVCGGSCVTRTAPLTGTWLFQSTPSDKSNAHPIVNIVHHRCCSSPLDV